MHSFDADMADDGSHISAWGRGSGRAWEVQISYYGMWPMISLQNYKTDVLKLHSPSRGKLGVYGA